MTWLAFIATVAAVIVGNLVYDIGNDVFDKLLGHDDKDGDA